ncbi:FAD-binding, type 2 [Diplogelasinospora grovesii]|uniref:FAD-binding, type 2 n=1 Tax=Diplogelasinospora grovesii TaxID=303347 RepID=A0AAN6N349_9PEZI|nr:FAD-binding, type 2 [Diplogelasinospora grovesii]
MRNLVAVGILGGLALAGSKQTSSCKCLPGDSCWPSASQWQKLNTSANGNLLAVRPAGSVCYQTFNGQPNPQYNADACATAKNGWTVSNWIVEQQIETISHFWTNYTCDPTMGCNKPCDLSSVPQMVIMAKSASDIQAGVKFARDNNLRLVIRNTGHCYLGRSAGYGALAINTHSLQSMDFTSSYKGPGSWSGGAVKLGAGVDVVGGECPSVGIAGGYIQGGGHSPLSGLYGMGSDNALSFEIVLATGELVTANAYSNSDLFWALKGGGMGTYGVVTSVTVKTHPRVFVTGMSLNISILGVTDPAAIDRYWSAVNVFHNYAPKLAASGMYVWYGLVPFVGLIVQPFVAPNMTVAQFEAVVAPLRAQLNALNVTYATGTPTQFDSFYDLYMSMFSFIDDVGGDTLLGGRLFKTSDIEQHGANITAAYRGLINAGVIIGGHIVNPGRAVPDPDSEISSVHPVWRDTPDNMLWLYDTGATCLTPAGRQAAFGTNTQLGNPMRAASPDSAVYVNEGDVNEPNWQDAFWGSNYPALYKIKTKYDPNGVFWAQSTPGSERWTLKDERRLCKAT